MKFEKTETAALIVLFVGVILLAFTFFSAYGFLSGSLSILASTDLTELFGNAMAPLIEAVIRILYLGIMGWIGSILTIRGVQLLKREKETTTTTQQAKSSTELRQQVNPAKVEPKPEVKKTENPQKTSIPEKTPVPQPPTTPIKEGQETQAKAA